MATNFKTFGVKIGGKHSYYDYGLILTKKSISAPEPKLTTVDIVGRNAIIDLSEVVTGYISFAPRQIEVEFFTDAKPMTWTALITRMLNDFQGKKQQITFDDDVNYYWLGRVTVELIENGAHARIKLKAEVDPYKYSLEKYYEEWLWDPFDFELGIINEPTVFDVNGSYAYSLILSTVILGDIPEFRSSSNMTLEYKGQSYQLKEGINKFYDIAFDVGENLMTFTGNGNISIQFKGGSL